MDGDTRGGEEEEEDGGLRCSNPTPADHTKLSSCSSQQGAIETKRIGHDTLSCCRHVDNSHFAVSWQQKKPNTKNKSGYVAALLVVVVVSRAEFDFTKAF